MVHEHHLHSKTYHLCSEIPRQYTCRIAGGYSEDKINIYENIQK